MSGLAHAVLRSKLGACRKCMSISALGLAAGITSFPLLGGAPAGTLGAAVVTGFFGAFSAAHAAAFAARRIRSRRLPGPLPDGGCGCSSR